jgi:hypothetical protein
MAVFADGTYLDGLVAVTGADEYDVLDSVDRLVARSMVQPTATELGTRYRLLETLRQFAEERLVEQGTLGEVRDRHLAWLSGLARWMRANRVSSESGDAFRRYVAELDNIRSAIAHAIATGQHEAAWEAVGDCGHFIVSRPSFETLDWLEPAEPIERWSEGVAEGIGWLGHLGSFYGDPEAPRRALEAVPVEYHDNIAMLSCRWMLELWGRTDPNSAAALLDARRPADRFDEVFTEFLKLEVDAVRIRAGDLDAELVADVQRRAAAYVEDARRRRDGLMVSYALIAHADILTYGGSPAAGLAAATEGSSIGEALGIGWIATVGRRSMADALAAMALSGTGDGAAAAREIRDVITQNRDRHAMTTVFWALDPLAALLWDCDAPAAYLLRLANRRWWATGTPLPANAGDVMDPATLADLEERANAMDADEIVAFALDALDRYLAAIVPR